VLKVNLDFKDFGFWIVNIAQPKGSRLSVRVELILRYVLIRSTWKQVHVKRAVLKLSFRQKQIDKETSEFSGVLYLFIYLCAEVLHGIYWKKLKTCGEIPTFDVNWNQMCLVRS